MRFPSAGWMAYMQSQLDYQNYDPEDYYEVNYSACPICGDNMYLREGPHNQFWGCSNYPDCNGTLPYNDRSSKTDKKCPLCGGDTYYRTGPHGKYIGCENYPKCKGRFKENDPRFSNFSHKLGATEKCPKCGSDMVSRKGKYGTFLGCTKYPQCKGTKKT